MNFLRIKDKIFLPTYKKFPSLNEENLDILKRKFEGEVIPIDCTDLSYWGGVLNCITWLSN